MRMMLWIVASLSVAGAAWSSHSMLSETYGSCAPYYGRTANMDKWSNPWPVVLAIDAVALAIVVLTLRARRRAPDELM